MESITAESTPAQLSQLESDELLARQLAAEDERESQMQNDRIFAESLASEGMLNPPATERQELPYRPYIRNNRSTETTNPNPLPPIESGTNQGNGGGRQRDEMDELSLKFEKLAEEGIKLGAKAGTKLSSLFQSLKAKVDELSEPPPSVQGGRERGSNFTTPSRSNSQREDRPLPASPPPAVPSPSTKSTTTTSTPSIPTPVSAETPIPATLATESETPKPDFSHLGLLPRTSVSLNEEAGKKGKEGAEDSDEDDLEYVRSPFTDDD